MKIAAIGSGGICRRHLAVLAREPNVEIVAHATRTYAHAEQAAREWGGRPYTDVIPLLKHEAIDAAWVCVPPSARGAIEEALIARRIPFFLEKPLSADLRTAETIAEELERTGVVAGVGYHWRALDTIPLLRDALHQAPPRMVIGAWYGATPAPRWWREKGSGGQIVEQATHLFDIARHLAGEATVVGRAAGRHDRPEIPGMEVPDVSAALLQYDGGAIGVFSATCLLSARATAHVQFVCDGLLITLTQANVTFRHGEHEQEVPCQNDPFADEDRAFLQAARSGDSTRLYCAYSDALLTHRLCLEARDERHSAQ